jgi:hypothetical protein
VWLVFTVGATLYREDWSLLSRRHIRVPPIHSEVVAWITATELQLRFYLAAFLFFLRLGEEANHKGCGLTFCCTEALWARCFQEQAITLPVMATVAAFCSTRS